MSNEMYLASGNIYTLDEAYKHEKQPTTWQIEAVQNGQLTRLQFVGDIPEKELFDTRVMGLHIEDIIETMPPTYILAGINTNFKAEGKDIYEGFELVSPKGTMAHDMTHWPFTSNVFQKDDLYQLEIQMNSNSSRPTYHTRLQGEGPLPEKELFDIRESGLRIAAEIETDPLTYHIVCDSTGFDTTLTDINDHFKVYFGKQ